MTHDPFQTYQTLGAYSGGGYSGLGNAFQTPFTAMQNPGINPAAIWNPLTQLQGIPQSISSGQLGYPGVQLTAQGYWQNPLLLAGLQQGISQNPFMNPLAAQHIAQQVAQHQIAQQLAAQQIAAQIAAQQIAAQQGSFGSQYGLQSPFGGQQTVYNPQQSGFYPPMGQIGFGGQSNSPFGQLGYSPQSQLGGGLAPQSWVGQAGQLGGGQTNPILLAQLTARALQAQGITPGVGFQF
jgi:hypothetical protein